MRESIRTVEDVIAVEPGPWVVTTPLEFLIAAASAIRTGRRIRFTYQSHHKTTTKREIEPYALTHTDGRWYLIGHCMARQALRTFRLDRATCLETSATTFQRPADFNARHYLAEHMPFIQSNYQIDVWIDMPIEEANRSFAMWRIATEPHSTGTRLRCGRDCLEVFAAMLLSSGRRIVVNHPAELRNTFRQLALRAMEAAEGTL